MKRESSISRVWFGAIVAVSLTVCSVTWSAEIVTVERVVDGDTFVTTAGVRVRLKGIDAPESDQDWGREARAWLAVLIDGRQVELTGEGQDRYGRTVAFVSWRSMDVGEAMVSLGHCWVATEYTSGEVERRYVAFESRARRRGVGLWSQANPVNPREWRARKQPPVSTPAPNALFGTVFAPYECST